MVGRLAAIWIIVCGVAFADESTTRHFQGLRDRRLFVLAERYALDELSQPRLPAAVRADWTIELSKVYAEHATFASGEEHDELWKKSAEILDEWLESNATDSRATLVRAQKALVRSARAEFLTIQSELEPLDDAARDRALLAIDEATVALRDAAKSLNSGTLKYRTAAADAPPVPYLEWRGREDAVRIAQARGHIDRAKLLPTGDEARKTTLHDAEEALKKTAGGALFDASTWHARVLQVECARLRGDGKQVTTLAANIERDDPPSEIRDRLVAVLVRGLLDERRIDEAGTLLLRITKGRTSPPPELMHLKTLTLLALWRVAEDKKESELADEILKEVETHATRFESEIGGWWGARTRVAFENARETKLYGAELGPAVRTAKATWGAGKLDEAAALYAAAAKLASDGGHGAIADDLAFTRASILLQSGKVDEAQSGFEAVVARAPEGPKASEAHLMGAYCLAKSYEADRTTARREAYVGRLEEHRERYAKSPTFGEATFLLASLQERRLQFTQAVPLYEEVPADHRRAEESAVAAARCYEAILDRLRDLGQPQDEWETRAIDRLDRATSALPEAPAALNRRQAEVCLRTARIRLAAARPDYAAADALLDRVLAAANDRSSGTLPEQDTATSPDAAASSPTTGGQSARPTDAERAAWDALRAKASQSRVVSLAGRGKWDEAEAFLKRLTSASPTEVLGVVEGLATSARSADAETKNGLGEIQLKTIALVDQRRDGLNAAAQRRLDESRGEALLATNQPRAASALYEKLLAASPKDRALKRLLADALFRCNTPDHLKKSKGHWRQLESTAKEGSPEWMRARLETARVALALGEADECRKLLGVTRLMYPELGGPALKPRYEELQRTLDERLKTKSR